MDETPKRPRKRILRSPNYPAFGLGEALERARTIYETERRNFAPSHVLAEHMGYKRKTGVAHRALSALRQYGLLEEKAGQYRISDLANALLFAPEASQEKGAALAEAAQRPTLFREILKNYSDGLPSDVNLRSWLITRKDFNPSSVDDFIRSFKETMALAKLAPGAYDGADQDREEAQQSMPSQMESPPRHDDRSAVGPAVQVFNWLLSMPRNVRAELRIYGRDLRREDLDRIRKQIDFLEEAFDEVEAGEDK